MSSIFSRAVEICSGAPLSLSCVPRERIFKRGNFFLRISSLPLLTPKNSIGFTVSRLIIVSVKSLQFNRFDPSYGGRSNLVHKAGERWYRFTLRLLTIFRSLPFFSKYNLVQLYYTKVTYSQLWIQDSNQKTLVNYILYIH